MHTQIIFAFVSQSNTYLTDVFWERKKHLAFFDTIRHHPAMEAAICRYVYVAF